MLRFFGITVVILALGNSVASAAQVVALGASNTFGKGRGKTSDGVPRGEAFPAQLERLLNASGCRVQVLNAGIAGDTTSSMLSRLPGLLKADTKVLILQPGGNDARQGQGENLAGNLAAMRKIAADHHVQVLMLDRPESIAPGDRLPDGQHFSVAGHARFAAYLAPQVRAAGACAN